METILVVEDDDALRRLVLRILGDACYDVIEADHPQTAIAAAAATHVDLLLSDVQMPDMWGPRLAARLREDRPGLPVLLMSGVPGDLPSVDASGAPVEMLAKPFAAGTLLSRVASLLRPAA
jgi:two-component system cell cycle sensor histidine kinase/response regulator CckA